MVRKVILLAVLVCVGLFSFAASPPPQTTRVSGIIQNVSGLPVHLLIGNDTIRLDTGAVAIVVDSTNFKATTMLLNWVKMWDSLGTDGQIPKLSSGQLVFSSDLTGSPFFDTVQAVDVSYVTASGDTVAGFYWDGTQTYFYNDGSGVLGDSARLHIDYTSHDSGYVVNGWRAMRLWSNALTGLTTLAIKSNSGVLSFQQDVSQATNWYYGALLMMALSDSTLDGQSRLLLDNMQAILADDSIKVTGSVGTGYVGSDTVNARSRLGINGDYITGWADVGATNADSLDNIPADFTGIGTNYLIYYDGSNLSGIAVSWADSIPDSAASSADEKVQDKVGAMLTGNTETGITVTYQDADGTIDFEVTGGGGGLLSWAAVDSHFVLIDSLNDTIFQGVYTNGMVRLYAEDGVPIVVGDTNAYARAPHGVITPSVYLSSTLSDTTVADTAAATKGYVDRNGDETALVPFTAVLAAAAPDDDSVYVTDNIRRGTSFALFRDSTINGSDTVVTGAVAWCHEDVDIDSLIFSYLTNGSIDTIRVMGPATGSFNADSVYATFSTGWTSATSARIALALDVNLTAAQAIVVDFVDVLADDNDRTIVEYAHLKGAYR